MGDNSSLPSATLSLTKTAFPEEIMSCFGGEPLINIGDETCCCFMPMSLHLLEIMKKYPLLYAAIVEGVQCAKLGYYSAGILAFSQLLKEFSVSEPQARHAVAHELLRERPSEASYISVLALVDETATNKMIAEFYRKKNKNIDYKNELKDKWASFMGRQIL